jgi:hypothetical protein
MTQIPTTPGTFIVAGHDVMVLLNSGVWYRPEDETTHRHADVQDFHGHSGFTVVNA